MKDFFLINKVTTKLVSSSQKKLRKLKDQIKQMGPNNLGYPRETKCFRCKKPFKFSPDRVISICDTCQKIETKRIQEIKENAGPFLYANHIEYPCHTDIKELDDFQDSLQDWWL